MCEKCAYFCKNGTCSKYNQDLILKKDGYHKCKECWDYLNAFWGKVMGLGIDIRGKSFSKEEREKIMKGE